MRKILFRGKKIDDKEWFHGNLLKLNKKTYLVPQNTWFDYGRLKVMVEVDPETVGQYTGLTDHSGKRIFEGDIIQSLKSSVTGLVQWFPEHSAFMVWCKSANEVGFLYECADIIKVIGNIHDNPELLKGGAE